jgi:hypothetical protein
MTLSLCGAKILKVVGIFAGKSLRKEFIKTFPAHVKSKGETDA